MKYYPSSQYWQRYENKTYPAVLFEAEMGGSEALTVAGEQ